MKMPQTLLLLVLLLVGQVVRADHSDSSEERENGCTYKGEVYEAGERVPHQDKCANCRCRGPEVGVSCVMTMCAMPRCVDSVEIDGSCCRICPNGPNCMSPHGQLLTSEDTLKIPYGEYCSVFCRCRSGPFYRRQAHCSMDCSFPGSESNESNESNEYDRSDESNSSEESRSSESRSSESRSSESDESAE